jgi:hypothetical protein
MYDNMTGAKKFQKKIEKEEINVIKSRNNKVTYTTAPDLSKRKSLFNRQTPALET